MTPQPHNLSRSIFWILVVAFGFTACNQISDPLREQLEQKPILITASEPGNTIVWDPLSTDPQIRNAEPISLTRGKGTTYSGIIISDTIPAFSGLEEEEDIIISDTIPLASVSFDRNVLGTIRAALDLQAGEYIEKQYSNNTFRLQRGMIADLEPGLLRQYQPLEVFDPARNYRVLSSDRNEICIQANAGGLPSCFSNVEKRILVIHQNKQLLVYELPVNL